MPSFTSKPTPTHLHIDFASPKTANAFGLSEARELKNLIKTHRHANLPVVVTAKNARVFCSGGNLSDYAKLKTKAQGMKINREIAQSLDVFAKWPVPKLVVVEGDCLGGALEWLSCFDFIWLAPHVWLTFWQKRIGLSSGWGGGGRWSKRVGECKTRQALLNGRPVSAAEALRLGFADRVKALWSLQQEIEVWAKSMNDPTSRALTEWQAAKESKMFEKLWWAAEHQAALRRWQRRSKR